jgi:hypothetical protein
MGIDAFVLGAQSVERLAFLVFLALHAFTPIGDADADISLRRIGVSAMPVLPRRAPHLYILGMRPFDVVVFRSAAPSSRRGFTYFRKLSLIHYRRSQLVSLRHVHEFNPDILIFRLERLFEANTR